MEGCWGEFGIEEGGEYKPKVRILLINPFMAIKEDDEGLADNQKSDRITQRHSTPGHFKITFHYA